MINFDEDSLICDLAETYNIYDYRQLPLMSVAVFSVGLRDNSRIKLKLSGSKVSLEEMLLGGMLDRLSLLVYAQTKDAQKGINKPEMISEKLVVKEKSDIQGFASGKEFELVRNEILNNLNKEGYYVN